MVYNVIVTAIFESEESQIIKIVLQNHRMGKTKDLFKKIRDTKVTLHTPTGPIKDRKVWN